MTSKNRFTVFAEKSNHEIKKLLHYVEKAEKKDAAIFSRRTAQLLIPRTQEEKLQSDWLSMYGRAEPRRPKLTAESNPPTTKERTQKKHVSFNL